MQPIHFTRPDARAVQLLPWHDRDLDQMAEVSDADKRKAKAYWQRYLPPRLAALLEAASRIRRL